jgi:hypothetical protein
MTQQVTSEFNEAGFQIVRLHRLWIQSKVYRESGQLLKCRWILDTATIELWADIRRLTTYYNESEGKKKRKYADYISIINKLDERIKDAIQKRDDILLYEKLIEKEKHLRIIQETAGKGATFRPIYDEEEDTF